MREWIVWCLNHNAIMSLPFMQGWIMAPLAGVDTQLDEDFGCYIMGGEL